MIRYNQADAGDEQHMLPASPRPACPSHKQRGEHKRRPALGQRRRFGKPAHPFDIGNLVSVHKKCNPPVDKKVAQDYR
ncbi:MAG: hypothetical protein JF612_12920 [Planctomycetia bacterium]|nr:hypothetical protein [Planctomycetia bacterium]